MPGQQRAGVFDTFIAGAKVLRQYGLGPLPGVAMMVVLVSRGGFAAITARYDRAAIANDPDLFAECLRRGLRRGAGSGRGPPPPSPSFDVKDDSRRVGTDRCPPVGSDDDYAGGFTQRPVAEWRRFWPTRGAGGRRVLRHGQLSLVARFTSVIMTQGPVASPPDGRREFIGMVQAAVNLQLGRARFEDRRSAGARMLRQFAPVTSRRSGSGCSFRRSSKRIYPEMRELVHATWNAATPWCLGSSALTIQVDPVAKFLGIENTLTNRFEVDEDDVLTGKAIKPILWGRARPTRYRSSPPERHRPADSYFYADGDEDVALMYLVGNPVRPTRRARWPRSRDGAAGRSCSSTEPRQRRR